MTSRDSWQQSKIYPTYSLHIVCSFRSEEHQFSQIYIRIIQKDSRNSWIFHRQFKKTSNLSRNIGNENANVMCEGEGENSKCWKVMIDVEKKAWNITWCTFVTYLGNTYTIHHSNEEIFNILKFPVKLQNSGFARQFFITNQNWIIFQVQIKTIR